MRGVAKPLAPFAGQPTVIAQLRIEGPASARLVATEPQQIIEVTPQSENTQVVMTLVGLVADDATGDAAPADDPRWSPTDARPSGRRSSSGGLGHARCGMDPRLQRKKRPENPSLELRQSQRLSAHPGQAYVRERASGTPNPSGARPKMSRLARLQPSSSIFSPDLRDDELALVGYVTPTHPTTTDQALLAPAAPQETAHSLRGRDRPQPRAAASHLKARISDRMAKCTAWKLQTMRQTSGSPKQLARMTDEAYQRDAALVVEELDKRSRKPTIAWMSLGGLDTSARNIAADSTGHRFHSADLLPKVRDSSPHDRDDRQRILELLKLELDASSSLNQRATILFALLTAIAAAVIAVAGAFWLKSDQKDGLVDDGTWDAVLGLAGLTLVCLCIGTMIGLWAVMPRSTWREEARTLLVLHIVGAPARWHSGVLVDAADKQRIQNERKARCLRWQAIVSVLGLVFAFAHVLIVIAAGR